jgi:tRNA nucleotidyltransferase (CCA-adding enzyme)
MKIYEVGGAVRDALLNKKAKDKDWVVVGASPEEMVSKGFKPIGKDFPVFLHPESNEEYALARTERKTGHGYHGFNFYYGKEVTLEEDLSRRDLTINAIAKDSDGNIIDPYGGRNDIKNKIFRHVSDAFSEDPLRAIRLARFHTYEHLKDFSIDETTERLLEEIISSGEIANLSSDRIWAETNRALSSKNPNIFFEVIIKYKMHSPFFSKLRIPMCDTSSNNLVRWAELQVNNDFSLGDNLPVPNAQNNSSDVLMRLMKITKDISNESLIDFLPVVNMERNQSLITDLCCLPHLSDSKDLILRLLANIIKADFSVLKNMPTEKIYEEKHKIYKQIVNQSL